MSKLKISKTVMPEERHKNFNDFAQYVHRAVSMRGNLDHLQSPVIRERRRWQIQNEGLRIIKILNR